MNDTLRKIAIPVAAALIVAVASWMWRAERTLNEYRASRNFDAKSWKVHQASYDDNNRLRECLDMPIEMWTDHLRHAGIRD